MDLLQADGLAVEGLRQELLTRVKAECSSVADAAPLEVSMVIEDRTTLVM
jgi:hypothetical protein